MAGPAISKIQALEEAERKRRACIQDELQFKLEHEEKAHKIVERLLSENPIKEQFLIDCAKFINGDHYKDVTEERAIAKQCGYPICNNILGPSPKQKYHISMRSNKVYDITERKFFCSNICFKASKYYASQISSTPLWMRDDDGPPAMKLLGTVETERNTASQSKASSGVEVVLKSTEFSLDDVENCHPRDDSKPEEKTVDELVDDIMSINFFRDENKLLEELGKKGKKSVQYEKEENKKEDKRDNVEKSFAENEQKMEIENEKSSTRVCMTSTAFQPKTSNSTQNDPQIPKTKNVTQPKKTMRILEPITECLMQWRTERTLLFFNAVVDTSHDSANQSNDSKINAMETKVNVHDQNSLSKENVLLGCDTETNTVATDSIYSKEMVNRHVVARQQVESSTEQKMRKMESEAYKMRVEHLYYGKPSTDVQTKKGGKSNVEENTESNRPIFMPYVDSQSQMAIRRKIMLDRLNRAFSEVIGPLHISVQEFSTDINSLVQTFHLGNKNISFKPIGWTLLAILLLNMLARKNEAVNSAINSAHGNKFVTTMLSKLGLDTKTLEAFIRLYLSQ